MGRVRNRSKFLAKGSERVVNNFDIVVSNDSCHSKQSNKESQEVSISSVIKLETLECESRKNVKVETGKHIFNWYSTSMH